jgi:putative oxidoreductase
VPRPVEDLRFLRLAGHQKDLSPVKMHHPDMLTPNSRIARWAPVPLRLIVGYGFMEHGFAKLARGPEAFAAILHAIGVPAPHVMAWSTILIEVLGGLAVILGAFVALVALPMAALLVVAIFTVHLPYGFSSIKLMSVTAAGAQFGPPGYELNLLYLACLVGLVLGGPGPLAIDGLVRTRAAAGSTCFHGLAYFCGNQHTGGES